MNNMGGMRFWKNWGLISRLMLAVGIAIIAGGGVQTYLLMAEGAAEHSARLKRELNETLTFIAPLIADQAILGEYAVIDQLLNNQVKKGEIDSFQWTDKEGKKLVAYDKPDTLIAPAWFSAIAAIDRAEDSIDVTAGGVGYGRVGGSTTNTKAYNRLWHQFVKQLQIVGATLFLMLQFIWLIFRGNLGTLRMLAEGANRFSQGDYAVRIDPEGAPEVKLAAEAFNNMANNIEGPDRLPRQERIEEQAARDHRRAVERGHLDQGSCRRGHQLELRRRGDVRLRPRRGDGQRARRGRVDAGRGGVAQAPPHRRGEVLLRHQGGDALRHRRSTSRWRSRPCWTTRTVASAASLWRATSPSASAARKRCASRARKPKRPATRRAPSSPG